MNNTIAAEMLNLAYQILVVSATCRKVQVLIDSGAKNAKKEFSKMACTAYEGEGFKSEGKCTELGTEFKSGMQRPCEHVPSSESCPLVIMRG